MRNPAFRVRPLIEARQQRILLASSIRYNAEGVPTVQWNGREVLAEPGEYIVSLRHDAPAMAAVETAAQQALVDGAAAPAVPAAVQDVLSHLPFEATFKSYAGAGGSFVVRVAAGESPERIKQSLLNDPNVDEVVPNLLSPLASVTPNPPITTGPGANGSWWVNKISLTAKGTTPGAWDYTTGSSSLVTAVVDSGTAMKIDGSYKYYETIAGNPAIDLPVDYQSNLFRNAADATYDGANNDQNALATYDRNGVQQSAATIDFVDDVSGWNFYGTTNYKLDSNGNPLLDSNGTKIPIAGANNNNNPNTFFTKDHGNVVTGILASNGGDGLG